MASDAKSTTAAGPNKAQAEFDKYAQRRRAQAAATGADSSAAIGPEAGAAGFFPGEGLTWAVPFGVGMAPAFPSGPAPDPGGAGLGDSVGGLTGSIGATVRLGVDLLNAALFSGVKILGGFTGAYGHGHDDGCGCGCGSGYVCESCCEPSCCEPDCCGCECCHPGVGSCC
jgi:hypothetical protein